MTVTLRMNPISRIERAIALMESRLNEGMTPSLDELAEVAAMSKYHFHRVYRLLTGETPAETQRRLRLAQAVERLRTADLSVTEIAFDAGFSSSQAFAKAIQNAVGQTATDLRNDPEHLGGAYIKLSERADSLSDMSVELAQTNPLKLLLTRHHGDPAELDQVYGGLFEAAGGPENVSAILGFMLSDEQFEPAEQQDFIAALQLGTYAPHYSPDYDVVTEEAGIWIVKRHVGAFDGISSVVDQLTLLVLTSPDVELADRPVLVHYLDDPESRPEDELRQDIYVPLMPVSAVQPN